MPPRVRKTSLKKKVTMARLDALARGQIWGMHLANAPREQMITLVEKKDGSGPTLRAVDRVIAHKTEYPRWRGQDSCAGGRPVWRIIFLYDDIDDMPKRAKRSPKVHSRDLSHNSSIVQLVA